MFGTLSQTMGRAKAAIKRLILKIKALFTITKSSRYEGAPVRVVTRRKKACSGWQPQRRYEGTHRTTTLSSLLHWAGQRKTRPLIEGAE